MSTNAREELIRRWAERAHSETVSWKFPLSMEAFLDSFADAIERDLLDRGVVKCPECRGTGGLGGYDSESWRVCPTCRRTDDPNPTGTGTTTVAVIVARAKAEAMREPERMGVAFMSLRDLENHAVSYAAEARRLAEEQS